MAYDEPSATTWQQLLDAARRFQEAAPWQWAEESDIFGVEDPESGELGFVSIMGMAGEHHALALYRGADGLAGFRDLNEQGPSISPLFLLNVPQLQVSFEEWASLEARDRALFEASGVELRVGERWPLFRSFRPGYAPWHLEEAEARFLTHALIQAVAVMERYHTNPALLDDLSADEYLVRVAQRDSGQWGWQDEIRSLPRPEAQPIPVTLNAPLLEKLRQQAERQPRILEIDLILMPAVVQENEQARPVFPYLLLLVDSQRVDVLGSEVLDPSPSLEAMWGQIPGLVVTHLHRLGFIPQEVRVDNRRMYDLLNLLAGELSFELVRSESLPALAVVAQAVQMRFSG